ncbi:DUF859 domain-containing protein [Aerococcaceae bacterium NML191219]|nr:DUF859 domain-containing protein [Aerococcaceae bacterium NML191219]
MANNGSFSTTGYEGRHLVFSWQVSSQSIDNNQTTIAWSMKGAGGQSGYWYMAGNFKVVIDGATVYSSTNRIQLFPGTIVASGTYTFTHNSDGSRRLSASCEAGIYYYAVNCSGSGSYELPTIARATHPTVNQTSLFYGEGITIHLPRASTHFTHTIQASVEGKLSWTTIATNINTSYTWYVPKSWARYLPNSTDRIKIKALTYLGSMLIGSKDVTSVIEVKPTADMTPVVTLTLTDAMRHKDTYGGFVKGQSKIKAKVTERLYEQTIVSSRTLTLNGVTYQSSEQTSEVLSSTDQTVKATVTDARGMTGIMTQRPTVYDWYSPQIIVFKASRCNASGVLDEVGNYIKLEYSVNIANVNNRNRKALRYGYKKQTDSSWSYRTIDMTSFNKQGHVVFSASGEYSWDIRLELTDAFATTASSTQVGTAYVLLDFHASGKGVAIGKVAESERVFDLASDWALKYKNEVVSDFIVSQGITNDWIWRKYYSGIAECFKRIAVKINVKNIWGNLYTSGAIHETNLTYPFSFVDTPIVQGTLNSNGWGGILMSPGGSYRPTRTHTGYFEIARGTQSENSYYFINYHVIGRWKT